LSFDEHTQTVSVGTNDWLEASKDMQIRGYLPPVSRVATTTGFLEPITQLTATGHEVPAPVGEDIEHALDTVNLPVKTPERLS
jgi:kynureninase